MFPFQRGRIQDNVLTIIADFDRRANPVEVIYAALPALLYFNSSLARDLLLPLFEFQSSPSYSNGYASPDLGPYIQNKFIAQHIDVIPRDWIPNDRREH